MGSPAAATLDAELDRLTGEFEAALSLAGQGEMLELTGLDARIAAACTAAQALPAAEARVITERLGRLVALLDRLAATLAKNFGNLPREADVSPQDAAVAYGKGSGDRRGQP
jgi:hypothetical protein